MSGRIRIIGGKFKGQTLKVCDVASLRPTASRVRESLFNMLQFDIQGAVCLDAFAGSGAIGIEALSRGAQQVTFLEINGQAYLTIKESLQNLKISNYKLFKQDCLTYLTNCTGKFDIIFIDPPFKCNLWSQCLEIIYEKNCLNDNGIVYLEAPSPIVMNNAHWFEKKSNKVAGVYYSLCQIIHPKS